MIANCEMVPRTSSLTSLLSAEVREVVDEIAVHRDRAARSRATSWQFEDPLRNWETRVRVEATKGRKWKAALTEIQRLALDALALFENVLGLERRAIALSRAALAKIRIRGSRSEQAIPPGTLALLERSCDRREEAAEDLARFLDVSRRVVSFDARMSRDEFLKLLDERRSNLLDARMKRRESETLERNAFYLETPPEVEEEKAEADPETTEDENWEAWLRSVQDEGSGRDAEADEWDRLVRDVTSEAIAADINRVFAKCAGSSEPEGTTNEEAEMSNGVSGLKRIESLRAELESALGQAEKELESQLAEAEERNRALAERLDERERELAEASEKARRERERLEKEHCEELRAERTERERSDEAARESAMLAKAAEEERDEALAHVRDLGKRLERALRKSERDLVGIRDLVDSMKEEVTAG